MKRRWGKLAISCFMVLILLGALGLACGEDEKEVVAGFSATPKIGASPLVVQFLDESTGDVTGWAWNFGDNGTSTERNPSHTYAAAGEYTVTLVVTGADDVSDTETKTGYIEVGDIVADFTATPTSGSVGVAGLEVQFTDTSVGEITAWAWDFDNNGTVDSTDQNPSNTYAAAGTYSVSLKVTGAAGSNTEVKGDYIGVLAVEEVVITIGTQTDFTGGAAEAMIVVNYSLEDLVRYYNAENLIPGVTLQVIHYDNQYNTTRDELGYVWLKERGADVTMSGMPSVGETLKPLVDEDKFVNFSMVNTDVMTEPPGYVFTTNAPSNSFAMTLLKWIAEEQWDWETKGSDPIKVGAAGNYGAYEASVQQGLIDYAQAHPDQFELVYTNLGPWTTFDYSAQVAALLDVDYLIPPATGSWLAAFTKQYRDEGGDATFLWTDSHPSYLEQVVETVGWEALDGTLDVFINGWWGETDLEIVALAEQLLTAYHDDAEAIMATGLGYIGSFHMNSLMLDMLAAYLNDVGGANFSGEGFRGFIEGYTGSWDGYEEWGYTPETRFPWGHVGLYEISADAEGMVRLVDDWLPVVLEP